MNHKPNPDNEPLPVHDLKDLVVETIHLSAEDQRALVEAFLNPPPLAPAMLRAIEAHRRLTGQG